MFQLTNGVTSPDAREVQIGKWRTRQGNDLLSIPIGEAVNVQEASLTGASTFDFSSTTWWAAKVVATASGPLTALEARIQNTHGATGTIVLVLYTDNAGTPGTEIFRTTIANSAVTSSLAYVKGRSITCPDIVNGTTYWIVGFVQNGGTNTYTISTTTNTTTSKTSTNSGQTWSAAARSMNVRLSTATSGGSKGCIRVKRPNGNTVTFMAHGTTLYSVNETTGATTPVATDVDVNATNVRFAFVNDVLYWTDGLSKPHKYDFVSATTVAASSENVENVIEHKGFLFYKSTVDTSKAFYTNFGLYDTFTATDFFYVPSPKTADSVKAFAKLTGNLYILTPQQQVRALRS
jgi:hypothetical protein